MKRSQVSVEFLVIFTIVLFMLAVFIAFFPDWLEKTNEAKNLPEKIARDIKARVITASLSDSDFESNITLQRKIHNTKIEVEVKPAPDNLLLIKDADNGVVIAKAFLPVINSTSGSGFTLTIRKEVMTNNLSIILS